MDQLAVKESFKAKGLEEAMQALNYAQSQGIERTSTEIHEKGNSVMVEVEFKDTEPNVIEQLHHYTERLGITWDESSSKK